MWYLTNPSTPGPAVRAAAANGAARPASARAARQPTRRRSAVVLRSPMTRKGRAKIGMTLYAAPAASDRYATARQLSGNADVSDRSHAAAPPSTASSISMSRLSYSTYSSAIVHAT